MRDQIQALFDTDDYAAKVPLARSTWSDALANPQRSEILREAVQVLVRDARNELPDRFAGIQRVRGTAHLCARCNLPGRIQSLPPCYPHEGGTDNRKGHMTLTTYDMRASIAVDSNTETTSIDEMRFVKEVWRASWWTSQKNAVYVVDRAFMEARYWGA